MRTLIRVLIAGLLVAGGIATAVGMLPSSGLAQEAKPTMDQEAKPTTDQEAKPTREDAKATALKAAALIAAQGLNEAAKAFNADGEFKQGEIYVNVIDFDGVWKVYPPRPIRVGLNVSGVVDPDGKPIVQEILAIARRDGEGWVEYRWLNPATNRIESKVTFVKRVPDQDLVAYVGVYQ
ncbi:cache domain-containing protein [Azospirillum canadense]|uniref:cache domain-containing protein n=1 Tax=Azospirillum canadense TaxID=403962 RepID=UPI0022277C05|nr:cache domain-containing protein [Azospirillum canadense]MCW2238129.1 signal transduction histidine kinase [Azospirillum canadense]